MSEQEQLLSMLEHADTNEKYQKLQVEQEQIPTEQVTYIRIWTGPDDAVAEFKFDRTGTLIIVSVDES